MEQGTRGVAAVHGTHGTHGTQASRPEGEPREASIRVHQMRERIAGGHFGRDLDGQIKVREKSGRIEVVTTSRFMADRVRRRLLPMLREDTAGGTAPGIDVVVDQAERLETRGGAAGAAGVDASSRDSSLCVAKSKVRAAPRRNSTRGAEPGDALLRSFVVGPSNRLAYHAVLGMADGTGTGTPCLFVRGPSGVGKTHLLRGFAAWAGQRKPGTPGLRVRCLSAEVFTNEYIAAVRAGNVASFRSKYRRVDLLCVDDVHFLSGKEGTQTELLHTFDALMAGGARLVLASDEHPRGIKALSAALVSRFSGGAVVEIDPPDAGLRLELIARQCMSRGVPITDGAARYLDGLLEANAHTAGRGVSVRDVEGAVTQVCALGRLIPELCGADGAGITLIERAMRERDRCGRGSAGLPRRIGVKHVIATVAGEMGVTSGDLAGAGRHARVVLSRELIVHLSRVHSPSSYPEIALQMGRRGHSFAVMAHRRFEKRLAESALVRVGSVYDGLTVEELVSRLTQRLGDSL